MTAIIRAKPFNKMMRSMKKTADPDNPRRPCRKIHIRLFEPAQGCWCFRATASDCFRVAEDTTPVLSMDDAGGPDSAEINPPRLAAAGPVKIEMLDDRTVISFDDVSFTTMRDDPPDQLDMDRETPSAKQDPFEAFMYDMKTKTAAKPGRVSISCNPKYLFEAAEAMKDAVSLRIDVGSPVDPVILTGAGEYLSVIRAVLPRRSSQGDAAYREQLAQSVMPKAAEPAETEA